MFEDHDPFNEPERAHPRARELMSEPFFWDCDDEEAPFGSDEGHDAYYEFRAWRERNPGASLTDCLAWIMAGKLDGYSSQLCASERIQRDLEDPDGAFLSAEYDMFTLDATVIATALGQLLDEGTIDVSAKPYVQTALRRQMHPDVLTSPHRLEVLRAAERTVTLA